MLKNGKTANRNGQQNRPNSMAKTENPNAPLSDDNFEFFSFVQLIDDLVTHWEIDSVFQRTLETRDWRYKGVSSLYY